MNRVKKGRDEKNGKFVALKFVDRKKSNGKISTKVEFLCFVFVVCQFAPPSRWRLISLFEKLFSVLMHERQQ